MRSIDDIIADARRATAGSLREAFTLGGVERAAELKTKLEAALDERTAEPTREAELDDTAVPKREHVSREERRLRPLRPHAMLLGVTAVLTLALWHARAARILPACALLIGLGSLLRDWTESGSPE